MITRKMRYLGVLVVVFVCVFVTVAPLRSADKPRQIVWEYKQVASGLIEQELDRFFQRPEHRIEELNKLGLEGWELTILTDPGGYYVFKRQK